MFHPGTLSNRQILVPDDAAGDISEQRKVMLETGFEGLLVSGPRLEAFEPGFDTAPLFAGRAYLLR